MHRGHFMTGAQMSIMSRVRTYAITDLLITDQD
jgi:hypothetical protein